MLRSSGVCVTACAATLRSARRAWTLARERSHLVLRTEGVARRCDAFLERLDAPKLVLCEVP